MSEPKRTHTPGPWVYVDDMGSVKEKRMLQSKYGRIAMIDMEGNHADGYLIAAAPDLLTFRDEVARLVKPYGEGSRRQYEWLLLDLNAALDKTKGIK